MEASPDFSEAHFQLGLIYHDENDLKNAESHFKAAINSDNGQVQKLENRGEELLKKFQFQNAKDQFVKAQDKKNHCAEVNYQLSILHENQKKTNEAISCLEQSIALNTSFPEAHRNLGILLSAIKQRDKARLHMEKAVNLNYSDPLSHLHLGILMTQANEYSEGEQEFLSALDINPEYVDCIVELATLKLKLHQMAEAREYYSTAKSLKPELINSKLEKALA